LQRKVRKILIFQHGKVAKPYLKADESRRRRPVVRKGVASIPRLDRLRHVVRLPKGANLLEKIFGQLLFGVSKPGVVEGLRARKHQGDGILSIFCRSYSRLTESVGLKD